MERRFLGIDVGGMNATWVCEIWASTQEPNSWTADVRQQSLSEIIALASDPDRTVLGVALDAQLTWSPLENDGFRSSDRELQTLVPVKNWVVSQNSLMAVPVRGRQLAELLAPIVGTIVETHPRASLYLWNPEVRDQIDSYKGDGFSVAAREALWSQWLEHFGIRCNGRAQKTDDELDAIVCATIAMLYHTRPESLQVLGRTTRETRGIGPFVTFAPTHDRNGHRDTELRGHSRSPETTLSANLTTLERLRLLLEGVNPDTGEVAPESSPLRGSNFVKSVGETIRQMEGTATTGVSGKRSSKPPPLPELDDAGQELRDALHEWRKRMSIDLQLPAYCVISNRAVHGIACHKPLTTDELLEIYGIGDAKADQYGKEIINIVEKHFEAATRPPIQGSHT